MQGALRGQEEAKTHDLYKILNVARIPSSLIWAHIESVSSQDLPRTVSTKGCFQELRKPLLNS